MDRPRTLPRQQGMFVFKSCFWGFQSGLFEFRRKSLLQCCAFKTPFSASKKSKCLAKCVVLSAPPVLPRKVLLEYPRHATQTANRFLPWQISSYGGKLRYTVSFELPDDRDSDGLVKPDVRLEGGNHTIIHVSVEQPVAGIPFQSEVDMREVRIKC